MRRAPVIVLIGVGAASFGLGLPLAFLATDPTPEPTPDLPALDQERLHPAEALQQWRALKAQQRLPACWQQPPWCAEEE